MHMRDFSAALLIIAACSSHPSSVPGTSPSAAPNVLLIIGDDHGYADLSCAGLADDIETPALDRLARRGVRFTRAYATSPICNTSRMGLMIGSYHQRLGSRWYGGEGLSDAAYPTLAEVLRAAGYATAYVGKFHYGKHAVHQPGNRNFPLEHGYDSFFGFSAGRKHYLVHQTEREEAFKAARREHGRKGQSLRMDALWEGDQRVDTLGFTTELFGERAIRILREHAQAQQPLFLTLAFNAVHNFTHQLPEEYLAQHDLGAVRDWDPAEEPYYDWYERGRFPNNPEGRATYRGQLHYLDRAIAGVLDELDRLGMTENTIVIYVGDNGGSTPIYADNGPLRGSKYTLYEGGLRVPLIVSWPAAFEAGVVRDNRISAMDLFPTVAKACAARVPATVDGLDLGALLAGTETDSGHDALHFETHAETAVLQGRWKLKTAADDRDARYEMVELELGEFLYDLEADPGESQDVAAEHPEVVERLKRLHAGWRTDVGLSE
jgi:arylsulfatase B